MCSFCSEENKNNTAKIGNDNLQRDAEGRLVVSARVGIGELQTSGQQLSERIVAMCAAPEVNCVLLVDKGALGSDCWRVLRVSLADKRVAQCLCCGSPRTDGLPTDVRLLPSGLHIALALTKSGSVAKTHNVRLLARQAESWSPVHELSFDNTLGGSELSRFCVSRNLLLCIARHPSRLLVALQVTNESKLTPTCQVSFESIPSALCAFTSGSEYLVAIAHEDCTVRLYCHTQRIDPAGGAFSLEERSRVNTTAKISGIISIPAGLLLIPGMQLPDKTVRLCRSNGKHLEQPLEQPQLGILDIHCGCSIARIALLYEAGFKMLVALESR